MRKSPEAIRSTELGLAALKDNVIRARIASVRSIAGTAKRFGVSPDELKAAVKKIDSSAAAVQKELGK
jgi:hypothetical protein